MKNISLLKVTAAVFVTTLVSSFVSADDNTSKDIVNVITTAEQSVEFEHFDVDKNGLLSQAETKSNKVLHDAFAKVDVNGDATISKDEFTAFVKEVK